MSRLLLLLLTSLTPSLTVSQVCGRKNINQPDDLNSSIKHSGCGKGPGWAAVKPNNTFKTHDFKESNDIYELFWTSLVRWPECVTKIELFVNNDWQERKTQNPMTYKVYMPKCNQEGSYQLKLRIFFLGLIPSAAAECTEVDLGWFPHKMPTLSDFIIERNLPKSAIGVHNVHIFWKTEKVFATKCLKRIEVHTDGEPPYSKSLTPTESPRFFRVPRQCNEQVATVSYFFDSPLEVHHKTLNIKALEKSKCEKKETGTTKNYKDDTTDRPAKDYIVTTQETETKRDTTQTHLVIGLGAGLIVAPITLCLLVICVKRCRKKPEEETEDDFAGDLNEDYGVYYSAEGERVEIESEVRDYNPLYEAEEAPDNENNIVRDLNSAYGR